MKDGYIRRAKETAEADKSFTDDPKTSQSPYQEFKSRRFKQGFLRLNKSKISSHSGLLS